MGAPPARPQHAFLLSFLSFGKGGGGGGDSGGGAGVVEKEAMEGWVAAMESRAPRTAAATAAAAATASVAVAATVSAQQVGHNSRDRVCTPVRVIW